MFIPFTLVQSSDVWDVVPKIVSQWNLAAFALAVVLYIVLKRRKGEVPFAAWVVIVLLVAIPIGASVYGKYLGRPSIYRPRITVVDPQGVPVEDAKVWSSFGGEPKKVAGGCQFDIPEASKPQDGKLTIFASQGTAFLTGNANLQLGSDHNPAVVVQLKYDDSANVRGQVVDARGNAVVGARVCVVGYEKEFVLTQVGGNFELSAHKAINQQVLLHIEKAGFKGVNQYHPAGPEPAVIILEK
jgi:hypothetical protein